MKNRKSIISVLCLTLCMMICLSACGGPAGKVVKNTHATYYYENIEEATEGAGETETDGENTLNDDTKAQLWAEITRLKNRYPQEMPLYAADEETFAYTVVLPADAANDLSAEAKTFRSNAQRGLRADITVVSDADVKESRQELLIGKTNRTLSKDLLKKLKANRKNCADDFLLYAKDGKIAIVADTDESLIKAIRWFTETFCESERTWTYLRNGYEFLYAPAYSLPAVSIAGNTLFEYTVATPRRGEYVYGRAVDDLIGTVRDKLHYDMARDEERFVSADREILVGDLSRKESKAVTPAQNQYIICVVNNKLVVKGYDSVCLYYGIKKIEKLIDDSVKSGKALSFGKSYRFTGTVNPSDASTCQLTFYDEFDGNFLDNMWTKYDGGTSGDYSVLGGSIENAGRSLCYLKDGILHMPSARNTTNDKNFDESKITLKNSLWYRYGCLEVCAKMPLTPAHAAIWLNGLGEVDILENFSNESGFNSNIHKWFTQNTWDGTSNYAHTSLDGSAEYADARKFALDTEKYGGNLTDDFHVYSLDWTEDYFRFAVDGKTYFRYDYRDREDEVDFFRQQLYLILVCGIGSNSYGAKYVPARHDGKTYDFQVDYVRLYQNPATDALSYK